MPRREAYHGPLPTIANDKALGCPGIHVFCQGRDYRCPHSAKVPWAAIGLPDDVAILDIPRWKVFRCTRCGARGQVQIMGNFPAQKVGGIPATWARRPAND